MQKACPQGPQDALRYGNIPAHISHTQSTSWERVAIRDAEAAQRFFYWASQSIGNQYMPEKVFDDFL